MSFGYASGCNTLWTLPTSLYNGKMSVCKDLHDGLAAHSQNSRAFACANIHHVRQCVMMFVFPMGSRVLHNKQFHLLLKRIPCFCVHQRQSQMWWEVLLVFLFRSQVFYSITFREELQHLLSCKYILPHEELVKIHINNSMHYRFIPVHNSHLQEQISKSHFRVLILVYI
jgi:hypothetical protein